MGTIQEMPLKNPNKDIRVTRVYPAQYTSDEDPAGLRFHVSTVRLSPEEASRVNADYETMVFLGDSSTDLLLRRYPSVEEAEAGHQQIVEDLASCWFILNLICGMDEVNREAAARIATVGPHSSYPLAPPREVIDAAASQLGRGKLADDPLDDILDCAR